MIARNSDQSCSRSETLSSRSRAHEKQFRTSSPGGFGFFADAKLEFDALAPDLIGQTQAVIENTSGLECAAEVQKPLNLLDQWHDNFRVLLPLECPNSVREANLLRVK